MSDVVPLNMHEARSQQLSPVAERGWKGVHAYHGAQLHSLRPLGAVSSSGAVPVSSTLCVIAKGRCICACCDSGRSLSALPRYGYNENGS